MARRKRSGDRGATSSENFEPPIRAKQELPQAVVEARAAADAEAERLTEILEPRIEGHLQAYQEILDALCEDHRQVGDTMDFGLGGRTRWTAVWELAGRCLGLSNCLLVELRGGFAS